MNNLKKLVLYCLPPVLFFACYYACYFYYQPAKQQANVEVFEMNGPGGAFIVERNEIVIKTFWRAEGLEIVCLSAEDLKSAKLYYSRGHEWVYYPFRFCFQYRKQ